MAEFARQRVALDSSVPALLVRVGHYPVHHGSLGVVQTLGSAGVPVYAVTEDHLTPLALSRFLKGRFVWRESAHATPDELVDRLRLIGEVLDRPTVAIATDDEAAVILAEHQQELSDQFLLPAGPPGLARRLASKRGLFEICSQQGVPTPRTAYPATGDDILALAEELRFPVVVKNVDTWVRLTAPTVSGTTVVLNARELLARFADRGDLSGLLLQEYLPPDSSDDWFVHLYCDSQYDGRLCFVGKKAYSWPPGRGITADARSAQNPELVRMTLDLCRAVGYRGVADLDWRYDGRDGQYKLLDFNPRVGAQFRFGQTGDGLDVVRGLHLSMTGHAIPDGVQDLTRRLIVENVYLPARLWQRMEGMPPTKPAAKGTRTSGAWGERRDLLPYLAMVIRFSWAMVTGLASKFKAKMLGFQRRRRRPQRNGRASIDRRSASTNGR
jgi:D-aspartate ligase